MNKELILSILLVLTILLLPALTLSYSDSYVNYVSNGDEEVVSNVINFLKFNEDLQPIFTNDMKSHFNDVRWVILSGWVFVLFVLSLLVYLPLNKEKVFWQSGSSICVFLLVIVTWISIDFDSLFTVFHLILFPQGNWQFPSNSIIINLFPQEFFITTAIVCIITSFIIGLSLIVSSLLCNN